MMIDNHSRKILIKAIFDGSVINNNMVIAAPKRNYIATR